MTEQDPQFKRDFDELRKMRDELRVKAHLTKLEAEEAWHELEARWEDLDAKAKQIGRESGEALEGVQAAAKLLVSELHEAYKDIKRRVLS
jgi:SMC interacting uncharacterized protein involved in chromosome segregation